MGTSDETPIQALCRLWRDEVVPAMVAEIEKREAENLSVSIAEPENSDHKGLVSADLRGANLYGTEVFRAVFGETNLQGANLKKTKIEKWVPK